MRKNIKYTLEPEKSGVSFSFDHVHITWDNQLSLHQQDSWELSYVITGRGMRVIGDIMEPFPQGEVVLIPPNIPHYWSFDEKVSDSEGKIENITIVFTNRFLENTVMVFPELFDTIRRIQSNENAISFSGETLSKLQAIMISMIPASQTERISSLFRLLHLIAFPQATSIVGRPVIEDRNTKRMQNIYLYVMNNYQHNITLDEIARFTGMEKSAFCVFFKKMTKKSFFSFLTEYRIESSCQMLLKTTKSIAEICISSGFRDVPYYNRVFKRTKNITPSEYRRVGLQLMRSSI